MVVGKKVNRKKVNCDFGVGKKSTGKKVNRKENQPEKSQPEKSHPEKESTATLRLGKKVNYFCSRKKRQLPC